MKKYKKILQIATYPPPMGGIGIRAKHLSEYLSQNGCEHVGLNIGKNRKVHTPECISILNGLDYAWKVFLYVFKGYTVYVRLNGKSLKGMLITVYAEIISLLFAKKPFCAFHGGVDQYYFPYKKGSFFMRWLFRIIFSLAKKIICNNEEVKKKIMEYGIREDKIVPIPSFSLQYMEHNEVALSEDLESFLRTHSPVLFSYIYVRPEFNIDMLLEGIKSILERYPESGVIIVSGGEENIEKFWNTVQLYGVKDAIFCCNSLSRDMFLTILKKTTLMIRTPVTDGSCSSVLEAMALGIPIVATKNDARPEGVVLFQPEDGKDMVKKIIYALENYSEVKEQSNTAYKKMAGRDTLKEEMALLMAE